MTERVVYVEWRDPCCDWDHEFRSNDQLIADKALVAVVYLAPEGAEIRGDDWNDAPMCANAGQPYPHPELRSVEIRYGEPLPQGVVVLTDVRPGRGSSSEKAGPARPGRVLREAGPASPTESQMEADLEEA